MLLYNSILGFALSMWSKEAFTGRSVEVSGERSVIFPAPGMRVVEV